MKQVYLCCHPKSLQGSEIDKEKKNLLGKIQLTKCLFKLSVKEHALDWCKQYSQTIQFDHMTVKNKLLTTSFYNMVKDFTHMKTGLNQLKQSKLCSHLISKSVKKNYCTESFSKSTEIMWESIQYLMLSKFLSWNLSKIFKIT